MVSKLGIIAGGGVLPQELVKHCKATDRSLFIVALKGHAAQELVLNIPHEWVRIGAAEETIKILKRENVQDLVFAGSVERPSLASLRPDLWAAKFFAQTGAATLGDDGLLSALINTLQNKEGFNIVGSDNLLPELIVREGPIGQVTPDESAMHDIIIGLQAARELGKQDIGQAVIVRDGKIIGQEDKSGTDALLKTIPQIENKKLSGVLIKTIKPQQERRVDLPTIGPYTLNGVIAAGLAGIALQAGGVLILCHDEVCEIADSEGLFVFWC